MSDPVFAFVQMVPKNTWDALDETERKAFVDGVVHGMVHYEWQAIEEGKIDGIRLAFEDQEGNVIPEMVAIRGTIQLRA